MELMGVTHTDEGTIKVSIAHRDGMLAVEGLPEELRALCAALEQVALLATISGAEDSWIEDVRVGDEVIRLGIKAGGRVRLVAVPAL